MEHSSLMERFEARGLGVSNLHGDRDGRGDGRSYNRIDDRLRRHRRDTVTSVLSNSGVPLEFLRFLRLRKYYIYIEILGTLTCSPGVSGYIYVPVTQDERNVLLTFMTLTMSSLLTIFVVPRHFPFMRECSDICS
jgi:hypothetical protein